MSMSTKPATLPPTSRKGVSKPSPDSAGRAVGRQFIVMALNMTWQLAIVVLVPVLAGIALDRLAGTKYVWTLLGLALALIGMGVVLWRTLQTANRLPVPRLTDKQRREVQKRYAEEDDDL